MDDIRMHGTTVKITVVRLSGSNTWRGITVR